MGLIVTDRVGYFSEEKRDAHHKVSMIEEDIPVFRLVNTAANGRYRIEKKIVTDPRREALLQQISFEALEGSLSDYRLYVIIAPHILNAGGGNTAWIGDYKARPCCSPLADSAYR
jgi:glucoamylase